MVTYGAPAKLARLVSANPSINTSDDQKFYADDAEAETANGIFTSGTLTLNVDGIDSDIRKTLFGATQRTINGVTGVGPTSALAILSVLNPDQLTLSILTGDEKAITRAKGVGAKSAKRIILELKDKIGGELDFSDGPAAAGPVLPQKNSKDKAVESMREAVEGGLEELAR